MVTRHDVETLFQIHFDTNGKEAAIDAALESATAAVENYIGTPLDVAPVTDVFNFISPDHRLFTRRWPIAITEIRERSGPTDPTPTVLTEGEDFVVVDSTFGRIHRIWSYLSRRNWRVGYGTVEVEYDAGWADLPATIREAVARAAFRQYQDALARPGSTTGPVQAESIGEYRVQYGAADAGVVATARKVGTLQIEEQRLLDPYRRFGSG